MNDVNDAIKKLIFFLKQDPDEVDKKEMCKAIEQVALNSLKGGIEFSNEIAKRAAERKSTESTSERKSDERTAIKGLFDEFMK